ncbi:hypothetical protein [Streptomyces syringium]|uniref:hypothetical protein n=1 Tax=Streptomyces syringium TaxID=76729 RepID=UPI00345537E7
MAALMLAGATVARAETSIDVLGQNVITTQNNLPISVCNNAIGLIAVRSGDCPSAPGE